MISVTRLNNEGFVINGELIEKLEAKPDTTITLLNGHVYIVKEKVEEVIKKVIVYKKSIFIGPQKE